MRIIILILSYFTCFTFSLLAEENDISCDKTYINEQWAAFSKVYTKDQKASILTLKKLLQCSSKISHNDSLYSDIIVANIFLAEVYINTEQLDTAKQILDQIEEQFSLIAQKDANIKAYENLYQFHLSNYYKELQLYELAVYHYEEIIDELFLKFESDGVLDNAKISESLRYAPLDLFNNAALVQKRIGNFEKANLYYGLALEFSNKNEAWQYATVLQNLGSSFTGIGEYEKATLYFLQAEELVKDFTNEKFKNTRGIIYKNLAENYYKNGQLDSAYIFTNKALKITTDQEKLVYINQLFTEISLQDKKYEMAQFRIQISDSIAKQYFTENHPEIAENFMLQAEVMFGEGNFTKADSVSAMALGILSNQNQCSCENLDITRVQEKNMAIEILKRKANYSQNLKTDEWRNCYRKIKEIITTLNKDYILSENSKYTLAQKAKAIFADAVQAYVGSNELETAYQFAKGAKAMVLLQQVNAKNSIESGLIPSPIISEGNQLLIHLQELKKNLDLTEELTIKESLLQKIASVENAYEQWMEELELKFPSYYQLKYQQKEHTVKDLQKKLTEDQTILEYFVSSKNLFLFVINKNSFSVEEIPIDESFLATIQKYSTILHQNKFDKENFTNFISSSYYLYTVLLQPIVDKLTEELIIVPDDEINLIAFDALIDQTYEYKNTIDFHKLSYILNRYEISYQYSSDLILNKKRSNRANHFLGLAPSVYNENLATLESNEDEVKEIQNIMKGEFRLADQATYQEFINIQNEFNIIHFATHGIFNDEVPLDSRIEMADRPLFIYDLATLQNQMKLVVLSACETAKGKQKKGEGVISLSRALIQAGCSSIVSSLWSVSDQKTKGIMIDFYSNLSLDESSSSALTLAKRNYLSNTISRNTHPFYWAGFIHIGNPLHLESNNHMGRWVLLIGLLLIGIILYKIFHNK